MKIEFVDPFSASTHPGRGAAFLVLLGFVLSFLFIRTSTRMIRAQVSWWPGNIETSSGLHLHHLVIGIVLMLLAGFVGFAAEVGAPFHQIAALAFGIGGGLTVDEFALWVRLEDVYWAKEGRSSLDAVILVAAFMLLAAIGAEPFGLHGPISAGLVVFAVAQAFVLASISFLKGRILLGVVAVFIPLFGLWATFRLAKPQSPWARWRYDEHKLARAARRYPPDRFGARFHARFFDAIGGRPTEAGPSA